MSYILDALRRSQAERERGQVPGLGAQPVTAPSSAARPRRVPASLWWLLAASVLVLLAAAAVLSALWTRRTVESPAVPTVARAPVPTAAPAPVVATAVQPAVQQPAQPVVVAVAPLPTVVSAPPPPAAVVQPMQSPVVTAVPVPLPAVAAATAPAPVPAQAPTPPPTPAADARPIPYAQLSAEQRRELPPLQVSGSIWSDNAASRFVMLNGMVVREGDTVAPGLKLERIAQKSAVLRWRDLRFEIGL